jgi:hypothetical protein
MQQDTECYILRKMKLSEKVNVDCYLVYFTATSALELSEAGPKLHCLEEHNMTVRRRGNYKHYTCDLQGEAILQSYQLQNLRTERFTLQQLYHLDSNNVKMGTVL